MCIRDRSHADNAHLGLLQQFAGALALVAAGAAGLDDQQYAIDLRPQNGRVGRSYHRRRVEQDDVGRLSQLGQHAIHAAGTLSLIHIWVAVFAAWLHAVELLRWSEIGHVVGREQHAVGVPGDVIGVTEAAGVGLHQRAVGAEAQDAGLIGVALVLLAGIRPAQDFAVVGPAADGDVAEAVRAEGDAIGRVHEHVAAGQAGDERRHDAIFDHSHFGLAALIQVDHPAGHVQSLRARLEGQPGRSQKAVHLSLIHI